MAIPTISLIVMTFSAISMALALSMLFLVLWQAVRHRDNRLMALFMLSVVFWGVAAFMARFVALIGYSPAPYFYCIALGVALNSLYLFAMVSHYAGLWRYRLIPLLIIIGVTYYVASTPALFHGGLYSDVSISPQGYLSYRFAPSGYISYGIAYLFYIGALAILVRFRRDRAGNMLAGGIIISIGVLTTVVKDLVPFSLPIISAGISTLFFARAILRENLFNPLALLNQELIDANQRLTQMAEELRQADKIKNQFFANMSHELRTPLNAILTFNELMAQGIFGAINQEQEEYLQKSLKSGRHLLALINDVLDLSKIQSGLFKLFIEDGFDIKRELELVSQTAEGLLQGKPVTVIHEFDSYFPPLSCDKRRVRQVLLNLVGNAAKFIKRGTITLSANRLRDGVLFGVIDTGPGISPEDQAKIFVPFIQAGAGIEYRGGTGLGLSITKNLVEAHGGRIWVDSNPGEGAAFYVMLPFRSPPEDVFHKNKSEEVSRENIARVPIRGK